MTIIICPKTHERSKYWFCINQSTCLQSFQLLGSCPQSYCRALWWNTNESLNSMASVFGSSCIHGVSVLLLLAHWQPMVVSLVAWLSVNNRRAPSPPLPLPCPRTMGLDMGRLSIIDRQGASNILLLIAQVHYLCGNACCCSWCGRPLRGVNCECRSFRSKLNNLSDIEFKFFIFSAKFNWLTSCLSNFLCILVWKFSTRVQYSLVLGMMGSHAAERKAFCTLPFFVRFYLR